MDDDRQRDGRGTAVVPATVAATQLRPVKTISVNGRPHSLRDERLGHAELVRIAYPDISPHHEKYGAMTVTYRGGPHGYAEGILAPKDRTPIADGEVFIVTQTTKS